MNDTNRMRPNNVAQTKWKRYEKYRAKPHHWTSQQRLTGGYNDEEATTGSSRSIELPQTNRISHHPLYMKGEDMGAAKKSFIIIQLLICLLTYVPISQAFNSFQTIHHHDHHQKNNTPPNYHQIYQQMYNTNLRSIGPQNIIQAPRIDPSSSSRYTPTMFGFPNNNGLASGHHQQWMQTLPVRQQQQHQQQLNHLLLSGTQTLSTEIHPPVKPMQQPHHVNQVAHRRNEIQQQQQLVNPYQAYQLQPVRPAKLMAEYVANQGQRILKNLVNTTIADLVNQSTLKINANKNMMMMTSSSNQPATNILAGVPFPKMNKLYTLLFPTPSPPVVFVPAQTANKFQQQQQQQQASSANQTNQDHNEAPDSANINHQGAASSTDVTAAIGSTDMYLNESQGREEKQQQHQHQILSLGAPYESQPRPSALLSTRGPRAHQQQQSSRLNGFHTTQTMDSGLSMESINGDEWRRPDNDVNSLSQQEAQGFFDNQQQFDSDDLNENTFKGSHGGSGPEMDTDSMGSFESAELIVPHHLHGNQQRDMDTDTRGKPLIIRDTELYPHHSNNDDQTLSTNHTGGQMEEAADFGPTTTINASHQNFASATEPEFSLTPTSHGGGLAASKHSMLNTELEHHQQYDPSNNQSLSQDEEATMSNDAMSQESIESMGGSGDLPDGAELIRQAAQQRKSLRQPKRFQHHNKHHHSRHMREQQQPIMEVQSMNQDHGDDELASNQHQVVNETRGDGSGEIINDNTRYHQEMGGGVSAHGGYANEEPSSTSEQPGLKVSALSHFSNGSGSQQADDSYFTAHLPSQYDGVMRLPPEGYYDDYFKPPNSQSSLLHSSTSSMTSPHESDTNSNAAMPDFGQSSASAPSNGNNNNNLIEGAVQYETAVMEGLQSVTNNFTSGDGSSSRNKKHSVAPSYHSQIITADNNNNNQQFDGNNSNSNSNGNGGYSYPHQQPTVGYTKQYYANQQQAVAGSVNSRPSNNNDARIEFVTPGTGNRTTISEERGNLESLNYEIPSYYEKASSSNNNQQSQMLLQSNVTMDPVSVNEQRVLGAINNTHRYQTMMTPKNSTLISAQQQQQQQQQQLTGLNSPNEDSIKLIIANTVGDSRDPQSNEKLINYTSEGHNITRGKSPRNNFINKDMNEFPPVDPPATIQPAAEQDVPMGGGQRGLMLLQQSGGSTGGPKHTTGHLHQQQVLLPQFPRPSQPVAGLNQQQQQVIVVPGEPNQSELQQVAQGGEENEDDQQQQQQQYKTVQRIVEPADGKHLVMDLRNNQRPPANEVPHHEQHHQDHHNDHVEQQHLSSSEQNQPSDGANGREPTATDRDDDTTDEAAEHQEQQPKIRSNRKQLGQKAGPNLREDRKRERRARQRSRFSKQQTIARPQITQVSFNPKDLTLNPPKAPQPSSSESPLEAIAEIPHKVEQLRDNQPDKNELMNELLTALDRVKVAIYKLQPLTAKMNAIYRKSVTSNTRDIIMDNHKGTYAKRYPPGDYDDTYDRMHPSELLTRQQAASQRSSSGGSGQTKQPEMEANESVENAVYLPAPREVLEKHIRDSSLSGDAATGSEQQPQHQIMVANVELDSLNALESKLVATGIGRRLGDGRVMGRLSLDSGERLVYDDETDTIDGTGSNSSSSNATTKLIDDLSLPSFFPPLLNQSSSIGDGEIQEPLFGYRITIFRSPEAAEAEAEVDSQADGEGKSGDHLRYRVDDDSDDESSGNEADDMEPTSTAATNSDSVSGLNATEDLIATSESSLVDSIQQPMASEELGPSISIADPASSSSSSSLLQTRGPKVGDVMDESESKGKKVEEKSGSHKSGDNKKKKKKEEMMMKKKKKSHMQKRHKNDEESKKKKEYKKIKHNKGIISKEKKTMKRDKHIKAHDRGAAKEKALKERTQIEFFEREQIVDDEFEKGKKSTVKGGWQSGQDSKKSIRDTSGGGDTMSSGGSHYVKHEMPKMEMGEKGGHKVSSEASSAKKSNKFEKKELEAKGKKFKGWREKGYKIITETEFIDRGSLHDSAYKKRDKGAAHHQKFKKQEASSEGHHGSLLEHHKKSHKKEEKKSNEKKAEEMGMKKKEKKEMKEKKEKKEHKVTKKKKKDDDDKEDHKHDESVIAATAEPDDERPHLYHQDGHRKESHDGRQDEHRRGRGGQPMLMSATSSTFRPAIFVQNQHNSDLGQTRTLIRLLNSNVHDEQQQQQQPINSEKYHMTLSTQSNGHDNNNRVHQLYPQGQTQSNSSTQQQQHPTIASANEQARYHLLNDTLHGDSSNRRSDGQVPSNQSSGGGGGSKHQRLLMFSANNGTHPLDRAANSSTILDIVDNLTGRQINKTKIGTYDLEDHHTIRLNNNSKPLVRISNGLAKYFPFLATQATAAATGQQPIANRSSLHNNNMIHDTLTTSTTTRRPIQPSGGLAIGGTQIRHLGSESGYPNNINLHDLLNPIPNQRGNNHQSSNQPNNFITTNNLLMMNNQNHDNNQQQTLMTRHQRADGPLVANHNQARINGEQPPNISTGPTVDNQVLQFAGTQQTTRAPTGFVMQQAGQQASAAAAAHLLQLVHRASQVNQIANHQPGNLMDLQAHLNPLPDSMNRAAFISPTTLATNAYQPPPGGPMFHPAQMSFAPPPPPPSQHQPPISNGPNFGGEQQFADYEHDPILHRTLFTS